MAGARFLVGRAGHERALMLAACTTVLFATTVLAALAGYTGSVVKEGLRRTLAHPSFSDAGTTLTGPAGSGVDQNVRTAMREVFGRVPVTLSASARSDTYVVPGQERRDHPDLTVFAMFAGIEGHATLTSGSWPTARAQVLEAAVPEAAAKALGVVPGRIYSFHGRVDQSTLTVRVTGLFRVRRADDYLWGGDRLVTDGVERGGYTTYGPLVVPPADFTARFAGSAPYTRWTVLPDTTDITTGQLSALAGRMTRAADALHEKSGLTVVTAFPDLMTRLDSAVLVAHSTMLIPLLQLIALATYALLLVGRLITDHRRMEFALLRARGASVRQLAWLSAAEGVLLAFPAAIAAPLLAPPLLRLVAYAPYLRSAGVHLQQPPTTTIWLAGTAAALAGALVLTVPALRGIRATYVQVGTARGRGARRGALQRAGADLAFLAVAALALWQLAHYGGTITAGGIDPLLVTGPTLALLAGGTLLLRLVPAVSLAGERFTARGAGFAPVLGMRQISRRPLRYSGPALLLVMAVAVGVLSVVTGATWRSSQLAQADFQTGADLRVTTPVSAAAPAVTGLGGRYAALPGVTSVSPVVRKSVMAGGQDVTLLAGDARAMGLSPDLAAARPKTPLLTLPGRPGRLSLQVRIGGSGIDRSVVDGFTLSVTIVDGLGVTRDIDLGPQPADGRTHTRVADLTALAGPGGLLSYPLGIRALNYSYIEASGTGPLTVEIPKIDGVTAGPGWRSVADGLDETPSASTSPASLLTLRLPRHTFVEHPGDYGVVAPSGTLHLEVAGPAAATRPIPAIVTADLARQAKGGLLTLDLGNGRQPVTVAATVRALPATDPRKPAVLVDLRTLNAETTAPSAPDEWWLRVKPGSTAAAQLAAHPEWHGDIADRAALRERLTDAPLGAALQGALVLGFGAALALALVGFAVSLSVAARERRGELTVLRALGVRSRQVAGLLGVEQTMIVGLGLLCGLGLGLAVAALVVPRAVLTARAAAPYPPVSIVVSWPLIGLLLVAVAVPIGVVLLLSARRWRS